ncbi:MAG: radical SAM protein [Patescibacteria group bacterium]
MDNFPEIVTFRITSRCSQNCSFCYGPKNIPELDFSEARSIFALLASKGAKAITITGGEPLIRNDIEKIFSEIKSLGLKIFFGLQRRPIFQT